MEIIKDGAFIIGSYLVGAIPFCFIISKIVSGKRLTEIGDKNPGGWNLVFNVSKLWGALGIFLDMAKGYFAFFLAYRFTANGIIQVPGTTDKELISILAGCVAVAGHNYSPYLKFRGGKGLATWGGFMIAAHPITLPTGAAGLLLGLLVARNMIWAVALGVIFSGIFLWLYYGSIIYVLMISILILIMIPRQVNRSLRLSTNFKFRKEATLKDLFTPKIR